MVVEKRSDAAKKPDDPGHDQGLGALRDGAHAFPW